MISAKSLAAPMSERFPPHQISADNFPIPAAGSWQGEEEVKVTTTSPYPKPSLPWVRHLGFFAGHNDESAAVERTAKSPNAAGGRPAVNRRWGRQNHGNGIGQEERETKRRAGC